MPEAERAIRGCGTAARLVWRCAQEWRSPIADGTAVYFEADCVTMFFVERLQGMPTEYEQYLEDPNYTIINIPPNFMFKAKIFKPSRLCAIYKAA